jgi:cytochrome c5
MEQAVEVSFEILTEHDPHDAGALSRTGQFMFLRGRSSDAVALLERAAISAGGLRELEPQASLFLGNAYFAQGDDEGAVRAWSEHVALVGEAAAGRVPELIRTARERAASAVTEAGASDADAAADAAADAGAETDADAAASAAASAVGEADADGRADSARLPAPEPPTSAERALAALQDGSPDAIAVCAQELYAQHCAACHGTEAQGAASGPRLAGNARARQEANVRSAITFGRGIMPGFGALLSDAEIEALVRWLAVDVATPR